MNPYQRHVPYPDVYELSRQPRVQQYEPRPCDTVEFEADERMQNVVLSTSRPAGQTSPHVADAAAGRLSAQPEGRGRTRQGRLTDGAA